MMTRTTYAVLLAALTLAASGCSADPDAVPTSSATTAPAVTRTPAPQETGPVSVAFGSADAAIGGDRLTLDGLADTQQCALAANLRTLCFTRAGEGAESVTLGGIFGFDQYRDSPSLEANPPAPLAGLPADARITAVEPTDRGFLIAYQQKVEDESVLHADFNGATLWTRPVQGLQDMAVGESELLLAADAGVQALDPATGDAVPAAEAGTTLLGYSHPLSWYSTYQPQARGLAEADGGDLVDPRPAVQAVLDRCLTGECLTPRVLLTDPSHALLVVTAPDGTGEVRAYDAVGRLAWTMPGAPTSAVGYQGTYVFGFEAQAEAEAAGELLAVNAETGQELGRSGLFGQGAQVLGTVDQGLLVHYGIDPVGAYNSRIAVLPLEVTEGTLPPSSDPSSSASASAPATATATALATTAPSASASAPATGAPGAEGADMPGGWTRYTAEEDPFSLNLPEDWSVAYTPGDGQLMGGRYDIKDAAGKDAASLITNMSGLGGACAGGAAWPVAEDRTALPYQNRVSKRIATEPVHLEAVPAETGAQTLVVTDLLGHPGVCPTHKLAELPGLGTTSFSGTLVPAEAGTAKERQLRSVMLSLRPLVQP